MRLLKWDEHGKISVTPDLGDHDESYAILSHTWSADQDEVTFDDLQTGSGNEKSGYVKIRFCAEQARINGLKYFWADTCCINKPNHTELSEAITSMYRWYQRATVCYVYLADVTFHVTDDDHDVNDSQITPSWEPAFRQSRWFRRGWTLQELIAPGQVVFFSKEGKRLGTKITLENLVHDITRIPVDALRGSPLSRFPVAERMQWTRDRATKKKEDQAYCLLGIFNVFIPLLYGEGDNAYVRLMAEINKTLEGSTTPWQTVQKSNPATQGTKSEALRANAHSAEFGSAAVELSPREKRATYVASLEFEDMHSRKSTIKNAYSTTCEWFLKQADYLKWTDLQQFDQHRGFLWINGKPGTGKSTLMKFVHMHAENTKLEGEVVTSFFFNARGHELERTTLGMYRALLLELFQKAPDLQNILDNPSLQPQIQNHHPAWTVESLCKVFSAAVLRLGHRKLKCFIDALDECDEEQVREMIDFFEEVRLNAIESGNKLHICFASRHYPTIDIRNGQKLILEDQQGHSEDLTKYVQSHLRAGKGKYVDELRMQIQQKANGVFMWAVLVIAILNEEFRRGRIFAVKKRLQEIPAKLTDLLKDILRKDSSNMPDLLLCLQWILFAKRPMRLEEFYFAMAAGLSPDSDGGAEWDPDYITIDDMNRLVLNSSKGLAEITKSTEPKVQFIHESVRDFLIKDNGLCELWPHLKEGFYSLSHDRLKLCCHSYLSDNSLTSPTLTGQLPKASSTAAKNMRQVLLGKYPFLEYADRYMLHHAEQAVEDISQDTFLQNLDFNRLIFTHDLMQPREGRRYTLEASLLYILAEKNCSKLIKTVRGPRPTMGPRGGPYQYPFFAALANRHTKSIKALVDGNSQVEEIIEPLNSSLGGLAHDFSPLRFVLVHGNEALAELLIESAGADTYGAGYSDLCRYRSRMTKKETSQPLLHYAVQRGWESLVRWMISKGIKLDTKDRDGTTALTLAAEHGRRAIVQLLVEKGADMAATDRHGQCVLVLALKSRDDATLRLLLEKGACRVVTDKGAAALMFSVRNGDQATTRLLLERGVCQMAADKGAAALVLAAGKGDQAHVELILANTKIDAKDVHGYTALTAAVRYEKEAVVRLLLEKHADTRALNDLFDASLYYAVYATNQQILQLLLAHCAGVANQDRVHATALKRVSKDHELYVEFEMSEPPLRSIEWHSGSRRGVHTNFFPTPLSPETEHMMRNNVANFTQMTIAEPNEYIDYRLRNKILLWAAAIDDEVLVQSLLNAGADIETRATGNRTPLMVAASFGKEAIVRLLLENHANVESYDNDANTALCWAFEYEQYAVMKILVDSGAEIYEENNFGWSPWTFAEASKDERAQRVLLRHDVDGGSAAEDDLGGGLLVNDLVVRQTH